MLSSEQREIRDLAHQFVAGEIRPRAAAWDADAALDEGIFESLAELGFLGMRVPERWGGLDLDPVTWLLVLEELGWGDASVGLGVALHTGPVTGLVLGHGSDAQQEAWLPRLAAGEVRGTIALPATRAPGDAVGVRARREGDAWHLTGRAGWVTGGARAGLVLVFARTSEGELGCFLVDPDREGYRTGAARVTMGFRAAGTVTVELDGAPGEPLGPDEAGKVLVGEGLDLARLGVATQGLGIARAAMEHATVYASERRQFGRALADFGAIRAKLADMAARIAGARALIREVGAAMEASANGRGEAGERDGSAGFTARVALAKLTASEAAMWVSDEAVQVFGGYGYMRDYPVEKLMRDAKGTEIQAGTSEVLRHEVAGEILGASGHGSS